MLFRSEEAMTPDDHRRRRLLDMVNVLARARGYSARARRRMRAAAVEVSGDPLQAWKFVLGVRWDDSEFRRGKRPGRPAKVGLW